MKNTLQGKPHKSDFERGRTYAIVLVAVSLCLSVGAYLLTEQGSVQNIAMIAGSLLAIVCAVVSVVKLCRCPYCGKMILTGVLRMETCPKCRRSLITGDKVRTAKKYAKIPPERLPDHTPSRKKR